ncbi:putative integration host factor IHF alpha subunit [Prevotella intermedia]|uniref:Integration host factor IHF alpha subunit n=1 Tax=Prevotella intermedia TaxID=28131 RepID=A0AAD1BK28_PREIN|nr:HU family DNA-binding protein [Prevotella intermedia]AFJ07632.1 DNA-binding protein HU [Prevotella intermedia 17]APW35502.1 DNA-binding protein [Prevotella intermedia]BAR97104.1 putative integration host factor IHF alpha subunit [Prevotella intermedia]
MAKTALQLIADAVAKKHKITVKEAEKFVSAIFDVVNEGLKTDKLVKVKGLGTFKVQAVKPRESVNVNTGERVLIEGHEKVSFTPDATMKELVNKPFAQFETVVLNDGVDFADIESKSDDEEKAENTDEIVVSAEKIADSDEEKTETKEEITAEIIDEKPAEEVPQPAVEIPMVAVKTKEKIAEESEKEQKETVEEKETVVEVKAETVEEQPEQVAEVPKVNAFPIEKPKKINWLLWSSVAFAVIAVMYFFGYKFGKDAALRDNKMAIRTQAEDSLAEKTKTTAKQASTNTQKANAKAVQQATDEAEKYKKMSSDKRIRYGAYDIVGIEKTVVLKKGQTMQSYSRRALGPDMVGYFQVLNNATTMSAGDTMKVPKVELRPQYRTK